MFSMRGGGKWRRFNLILFGWIKWPRCRLCGKHRALKGGIVYYRTIKFTTFPRFPTRPQSTADTDVVASAPRSHQEAN